MASWNFFFGFRQHGFFKKIFSRGKILCCQFYCVVYWSMNGWENFILGEESFSVANLRCFGKYMILLIFEINRGLLNYVVSLFGNKSVLEKFLFWRGKFLCCQFLPVIYLKVHRCCFSYLATWIFLGGRTIFLLLVFYLICESTFVKLLTLKVNMGLLEFLLFCFMATLGFLKILWMRDQILYYQICFVVYERAFCWNLFTLKVNIFILKKFIKR